jgi:hypothetical protein
VWSGHGVSAGEGKRRVLMISASAGGAGMRVSYGHHQAEHVLREAFGNVWRQRQRAAQSQIQIHVLVQTLQFFVEHLLMNFAS